MSRINSVRQAAVPEIESFRLGDAETRVEQNSVDRENSAYRENRDSPHERYLSREGIERGHGRGHGHARAHGHHGRREGDTVQLDIEGVGSESGVILRDHGQSIEVLVDGVVYTIDKESGYDRGHRRAHRGDLELAEHFNQIKLEEFVQQQAQHQQQRQAEIRKDLIKIEAIRRTENRKFDLKSNVKKLEQHKQEIKQEETKESSHTDREEHLQRQI